MLQFSCTERGGSTTLEFANALLVLYAINPVAVTPAAHARELNLCIASHGILRANAGMAP
jgi:hypothetical protein